MAKLSRKAKILIGIFLSAMIITVTALGLGIWFLNSALSGGLSRPTKDLPPDIVEPRVLVGAETFTKSEFYRQKKMGFIMIILKSTTILDEKEKQRFVSTQNSKNLTGYSAARRCGENFIFAGRFGSQIFDKQGNLIKENSFEPSASRIKFGKYGSQITYQVNAEKLSITDADDKGNCGYAATGSLIGATAFDENGNIIWEREKESLDMSIILKDEKEIQEEFKDKIFVLDFAIGDIDSDGSQEFVILKGEDGVYSYDKEGKEKWSYKNKDLSGKLQIIDYDGDGKNELLLVGKDTKIFDSKGAVSRSSNLDKYERSFIVSGEKDTKKIIEFLKIDGNKLTLADESGKEKLATDAPLSEVKLKEPVTIKDPIYDGGSYTYDSESLNDPAFTWVELQKGKKYLAVVARYGYLSRSNFLIYEPDGKLIYHELIPEDAETILAVPQENGTESILVGGENTIWKYSSK